MGHKERKNKIYWEAMCSKQIVMLMSEYLSMVTQVPTFYNFKIKVKTLDDSNKDTQQSLCKCLLQP